ncbi:hypothetical protein LZ198_13830 [Myxococcus sp. K15C18031901]|uniref:LirA/MavJ family T4SS effector n=1 Tax=Myxococcus dinghuensis TaxID=2906761 RepID=UPI0020A7E0BD|nr:LirA/MavJ family T4SS effector [Myxococcus dinghuensis]MCP3099950.1 hypothetical protein [Myxococcus dinghuensis]
MAPVNLEAVRDRDAANRRLLEDCIEVRRLMSTDYGPGLAHLEQQLVRYLETQGTLKKALTTALQAAEVSCGLNPMAPIYMRFLTAEEFGRYGGQGMLFKDVGAGYLHGEYTHRLQWYVIFHAMSSGFTEDVKGVAPRGWNYTPLQLLIGINTAGVKLKPSDWPMDPEGNQGFWDALLDRGAGYHPGFAPDVDGIANPEVFSTQLMDRAWLAENHGGLQAEMEFIDAKYAGAYGQFAATYPTLSRIITQRYAKRASADLYQDRQGYIDKKLSQKSPKTYYVASPMKVPKGSLMGVLEMRAEEERKKGHCFLTTACVEAQGLPDDCEELQVLRAFRDGFLRGSAGGPELIDAYYALAPRIVEQVQARADARVIWEGVHAIIRVAVEQVRTQAHEAALRTYRTLVEELSARYLPDAPVSSTR